MSTIKFYKFITIRNCNQEINVHTKNCVETQKVYFNDWEKLNDPMEGFYRYIPNQYDKNIESILTETKQKYKIFCCSKYHRSILLWSHYADNHKGICLEIEIDEDLCKEQNIFKLNVVYKKNLVQIYPNKTTKDQAKNILKHKLSQWRYEDERRFFIEKDQPDFYKIGRIKSIILGIRCNDENMVKQWIGDNDIEIKKAKFNEVTNEMDTI